MIIFIGVLLILDCRLVAFIRWKWMSARRSGMVIAGLAQAVVVYIV